MSTDSVPLPDLHGKRILLGVTGSIAAYKAVYLLRSLQEAGAEVRVVFSASAGQFVGSLTFQTLSRQPVLDDLWAEGADWTQHVHLGKWADLLLVAPATANSLAKFAQGLCTDALSAVYLAADCPVLLVPAMDLDMHRHPAVQANLQRLRERGHQVVEAASGYLASGLAGQGRLADPADILAAVGEVLAAAKVGTPLAGRQVLISAGPTREPIDPVRFLTNYSSGRMGVALAEAAREMGAAVTLVYGPAEVPPPDGVTVVDVVTAAEMHAEMTRRQPEADLILMTAAVSDYAPAEPAAHKLKKEDATELNIQLQRTTDILAELGRHKPAGQVLVGFALESRNAERYGKDKLVKKNLDLIVVNSLEDEGAGFGHTTNRISLFGREGLAERHELKTKPAAAWDILRTAASLLPAH